MYSKLSIETYKGIPFIEDEVNQDTFYKPETVENLFVSMRKTKERVIIKVRVVGYLIYKEANHYLQNINRLDHNQQCEIIVKTSPRVSKLGSAYVPYPVHIIGTFHMHNGFGYLDVLSINAVTHRMAVVLNKSIRCVRRNYLAVR